MYLAYLVYSTHSNFRECTTCACVDFDVQLPPLTHICGLLCWVASHIYSWFPEGVESAEPFRICFKRQISRRMLRSCRLPG